MPYDVHTDASLHGLCAVIVQEGRPVAFASRTLTPVERNYNTTEQEALCVVYAFEHFYPYLYGAKLTIYTNHEALKSILSTKEPRGRIARWILAIQGYSFTIVHQKGILNADTDALSRIQQVNSQTPKPAQIQGGEGDTGGAMEGIERWKQAQKLDATCISLMREGVKKPFTWKTGIIWESGSKEFK